MKYLEGFQKFYVHIGDIFLSMAELNLAIIDEYKKWRIENGNMKESVNKNTPTYIKAAEYASNNELIKSLLSNFYFKVI